MKIVCYLLIILSLYSCKKDSFHDESVSGFVFHTVTKTPLVGQRVILTVTTYKKGKKDDEFPDGRPVYTTKNYSAITDNTGKYHFDFKVDGTWIFKAELATGEYEQKIPAKNLAVVSLFGLPSYLPSLTLARETYDTFFAERPGYIRYHVKNINDIYNNDTLFTLTPYKLKWIRQGANGFVPAFGEYNWVFAGTNVDRVLIDTVPAESEPQIPVKWLYKRADTILFKNETLNVSPGNTTDYIIHY
ncbi:MAG: hypothetical protein JNK14_04985 [Chitinophagaceae bacterium]|nr:hypothetical protein [Chitinophagaceae bacterium]